MVGSNLQPTEAAEDLGQSVTYIGSGERRCSDVGSLLLRSGAGRPALWRRELGRDHAHWAADGGILPYNGGEDIEGKAITLGGWYLGIPPIWKRLYGW